MLESSTVYIEFIQDWGPHKAGDIPAESLSDGVCRALIADDVAREIDITTFLRRSIESESKRIEARLVTASTAGTGAATGTPVAERGHRPSPPGGVDFTSISNGTRPADEVKNLCLADAMRCIFLCQARGVDPQLAEFGRQRLRHYVDEVRSYEMDAASGKIAMKIERSVGEGGLETITRDGTDSISGGTSYGFTLKPTFIGDLFRIAVGQEVFAPATRKVPLTSGNEGRWPALGQFSPPRIVNGIPMPASIAGVSLYYKGETDLRVKSDAATRMIDFKAVDLTGLTKFSRDYIVDNYIAMNSVVTEIFGIAMGLITDWVAMFGNGVGMPEGFASSKAFIQRPRTAAGHIQYQDITWMMSRMAAGCLTRSRWLTNQTTMPELMSVTDGTNRVFLPNSMVVQSDFPSFVGKSTADANVSRLMGTLQGLPVYFAEYIPALGQANDLMLVCPDQYGLAERAGLEVGVNEWVYWETDEIGYRFKLRHDGKSLWPSPYVQADNLAAVGSGTQVSPFIGITVS